MIATSGQLLDALAHHSPIDHREQHSLDRIRSLLHWLANPFSETADPTHVTSSGIVVDADGHLLLHRHRRLGIWLQPGGHVDAGEPLQVAVQREVREETGLVTGFVNERPFHVDLHEGPRGHVHLDIRWLLSADRATALRPDEGESPEVAWFPLAEAHQRADDGLRGAIARLGGGAVTTRPGDLR